MIERFSRSWTLVKSSATVLRQDPELLVFPFLSGVALLLLVAAFAIPAMGMGALDSLAGEQELHARHYMLAFLFYVSQYFIIFFFNAALVGAVMIRLDGGDPTVSDGLRIASSKLMVILFYSVLAATVGMLLRMLQERVGFIGKIIVSLVGAAWSIATFLVVPVLVDRDVGPIEAVRESASLLKDTWGENVIGQAGIGFAFAIIMTGVVLCSLALFVLASATQNMFMVGVVILAAVIAIGFTALVQAALSGVYAAALYRFASNGEGSGPLDPDTLRAAFAPK